MRTNVFNDRIVDNVKDDLSLMIADTGYFGDEVYAIIYENDDGKFYFEILENSDGGEVVHSDPIFANLNEIRNYLSGKVSDIQTII